MPFDPTLPAPNTPKASAVLRSQFNGLKSLIDAVPTITGVVIDSVTTLDPGEAATVSASIVAGILHLSLGIPRGDMGAAGEQGPPFSQAVVDGVTTLGPTDNATVDVTFDGTTTHFTFGIPRGEDGANGADGAAGEISAAQLAAAIDGTAANCNQIDTVDTPFAEPGAETMRVRFNSLVLALRR